MAPRGISATAVMTSCVRPRRRLEHRSRFCRVDGLAEDPAVQNDDGVCGEDGRLHVGKARGLGLGARDDAGGDLRVRALLDRLVDVGRPDFEGDAKKAEEILDGGVRRRRG